MELKVIQEKILALAKEKGWGTDPQDVLFAEKIALLHSEVSEVLEAYRKGEMTGPHGVARELGDVVARALHLAGIYNIDVEKEILEKLETDKKRDWSNDQLYKDRDERNKVK
jgi:NTP pyrophosphatase (non-canonical NTP hydrolase)